MSTYPSIAQPDTGDITCQTAQLRFSSHQLLLPGICQSLLGFAADGERGHPAKLAIVLRELLSNALEHGNGSDPAREVTCRMTRRGVHCVELEITDEGDGFDVESLDLGFRLAPVESLPEGLRLVHALCDELRFKKGGRCAICTVSWDVGGVDEAPF